MSDYYVCDLNLNVGSKSENSGTNFIMVRQVVSHYPIVVIFKLWERERKGR